MNLRTTTSLSVWVALLLAESFRGGLSRAALTGDHSSNGNATGESIIIAMLVFVNTPNNILPGDWSDRVKLSVVTSFFCNKLVNSWHALGKLFGFLLVMYFT